MIVLAKKGGYTSTGHHKYPALYWPHDLLLQPGRWPARAQTTPFSIPGHGAVMGIMTVAL